MPESGAAHSGLDETKEEKRRFKKYFYFVERFEIETAH
jgi:hypothetical protein